MQRRDVLRLAALSAGALGTGRPSAALLESDPSLRNPKRRVIDSHIHLFDPTRPGGIPWPDKTDTALYKPALPERYEAMAAPFGVVGAIAVEASPLGSDNDWLLKVVENNPVVVGAIGDLAPDALTYRTDLDRLHRNPLFLGFRYGNIWDRDLADDLKKPGFIEGIKALAQAGLVFESANPDAKLIRALLEIAERVPGLRIVADHLPNAKVPAEPAALKEYQANLHRLAEHNSVFVKLSEIPVVTEGKLVKDGAYYRPRLDALWDLFGEDRVIYGSDWPNSDHVASFADTWSIVIAYVATKSAAAAEKYYWKNSQAAYRWRPRRPGQPGE